MAEKNDDQQQNEGSRLKMLKAFDETNAGVKGLIDSGLHKVPDIFERPSEELARGMHKKNTHIIQMVPVIDLSDIQTPMGRKQIVQQVSNASETWGFFQVVNHGIPSTVMDRMIGGIREFHEQDVEEKKKYYTRDFKHSVKYHCNHDLFTSRTADWKDTLSLTFTGDDPTDQEAQELPPPCRESSLEYSRNVGVLGNTLFGLLSEALGLETDHLKNMECSKGHRLQCHYYPPCPEPQKTLGIAKHSDVGFLTIILQSRDISALQILYEGEWVDIYPIPGGLVVNIGDLLQLVSNGKFKSVAHRAITNNIGPRISAACFFSGHKHDSTNIYGPIRELISKENPIIYRDVFMGEYILKFFKMGREKYRALEHYKV